jgi:hypothetical protein
MPAIIAGSHGGIECARISVRTAGHRHIVNTRRQSTCLAHAECSDAQASCGAARRTFREMTWLDQFDWRRRHIVRRQDTWCAHALEDAPSTASIRAGAIMPGRSSAGVSDNKLTMVDSTPTVHGPPPTTRSTASPSSSTTCAAVVGETRPKRLA